VLFTLMALTGYGSQPGSAERAIMLILTGTLRKIEVEACQASRSVISKARVGLPIVVFPLRTGGNLRRSLTVGMPEEAMSSAPHDGRLRGDSGIDIP
jgi:hypothetical protein